MLYKLTKQVKNQSGYWSHPTTVRLGTSRKKLTDEMMGYGIRKGVKYTLWSMDERESVEWTKVSTMGGEQ